MDQGRDAMTPLGRDGSVGLKGQRASSIGVPSMEGDMDTSFEPMDLGLDFGELPELPSLEERGRRESEWHG